MGRQNEVTEPNALRADHPAIRAINGLIAAKLSEITSVQWRISQSQERIAQAGPYRTNPTSYEESEGVERGHYFAPVHEWKAMVEAYAELVSLDAQIRELQQVKLHSFRDCDFRSGDYWVPLLVTGHQLSDRLDYDKSALASLLATNPVPVYADIQRPNGPVRVMVPPYGHTDALPLLDLVSYLTQDVGEGDAPSIRVDEEEHLPALKALVPAGVLRLDGKRGTWLMAGEHALAFRHALRLTIRCAINSRSGEDDGKPADAI
jgi:hypothetical protein